MQERKIEILQLLSKNEAVQKPKLKELLEIKNWQLGKYLRELEADGYLNNNRDHIRFQINPKTNLFKKLDSKFDLVKLLRNNNDMVLPLLLENPNNKAPKISEISGLSLATVYRALQDFREIGLLVTVTKTFLDDKAHLIAPLTEILKAEKK